MISFDMREFEAAARRMGAAADQVPFALSQALNKAALNTRFSLIDRTWPQHVEVRNRNFLRNAIRVETATKRNLAIAITTEGASAGSRGHIGLHAHGGTKTARGRLAIPDAKIKSRRSGKGMPASLLPGTAPNVFRRGDVLYQVQGKGKRKKLRLLYTLKASAPIKATVPFDLDFRVSMIDEVRKSFGPAMLKAMRTRK